MEFEGWTCLVTGGSRGIGAATVELFASKGARVFTCSRKDEALDEFLEQLKSKGYDVQGFECDISDTESVKVLSEKVTEAFDGKLNVLVNNAGVGTQLKTFMKCTKQDFDFVMDTNVKAMVDLCQAMYPLLKASEGASVVNIGSIGGGNRALARAWCYNITKSAVHMLTMSLACEWASDKIRVNCVAPGIVYTPLTKFLTGNPDALKQYESETPMKRAAQPHEIANVIAFFASRAASYVTGQTLFADGGHMVRGMGY